MIRIIMYICFFCISALAIENKKAVTLPITISGVVMDDPYPMEKQSFPIANAHVELRTIYSVREGNVTSTISVYGTFVDSAITDSNGKFYLKSTGSSINPVSNWYLIVVTHPDYRTRQIALVALKDTALNVLLINNNEFSTVSGKIVATCLNVPDFCSPKPVPGCSVSVCLSSYSLTVNEPAKHVIYSTVTDAQGNYSIKNIPLTYNDEQVDITASKSAITKLVNVTLKNSQTTISDFNDFPTNLTADTSLQVYPSRPTSNDSVLFVFYNAMDSCCSIYRDMSMSVADSTIYINYNRDDSYCSSANCGGNGKWATIQSNPLNPGKYYVYKFVASNFCDPGIPCLPIPRPVPIPQLIGTLIVKSPTSIISPDKSTKSPDAFSFSLTGSSATVCLPKSSRIILKAFSVNGALLGELYNGSLSAGSHNISINSIDRITPANSMIIFNMTVNGVTKAFKRVNFVKRGVFSDH